jgi:hypothetical protein
VRPEAVRTIEDYLRERPVQVAEMVSLIIAAAEDAGQVRLEVLDARVILHGNRRIFASLSGTRDVLRGHLNLPAQVTDQRFTKVEPLTKRLWFHRFALTSRADVDDTFLGWVRQAARAGQGLG